MRIYQKKANTKHNIFSSNILLAQMAYPALIFLKKELKITDEEIEILTYYVMEEPEIHTLVGRKEDQQLGFLLLEYWRKYKLMVQAEEAKP